MTDVTGTLSEIIEKAARDSVPWPDDERYMGDDENGEDIWRPSTLGEFVDNTYIGERGGDKAFKAAARTAAWSVIAAGWQPTGVSDTALLAAYQRTDGEPGNPEADALAAEIERRGLDI